MLTQTQKVLLLCNCCSTTLGRSLNHQNRCNGTTGRAKEAEWRQKHCHGGSRVAVVAEWRHRCRQNDRWVDAKEAQWLYKRGRGIAQIDTQCLQQYEIFYEATNGRPLCIHSATTSMRVPPSCLIWATCKRPTSSATFVRLFWTCSKLHGDHGALGEVWTSSVPPWTTKATFLSHLCLQRRPGQFCGWHKGRSPCVKGVLLFYYYFISVYIYIYTEIK